MRVKHLRGQTSRRDAKGEGANLLSQFVLIENLRVSWIEIKLGSPDVGSETNVGPMAWS